MAGGVFDGTLVHIRYPRQIAGDVDLRVRDIPFVMLAGCMEFLDEFHECLSRKTLATIVGVKIWGRNGDQRRQIICTGCNKYLLDNPDDFVLGIYGGCALLFRRRSDCEGALETE